MRSTYWPDAEPHLLTPHSINPTRRPPVRTIKHVTVSTLMSALLDNILASVEIPEKAWPQVLASYRSTNLKAIARNRSLGQYARSVLQPTPPAPVVASLLWTNNPYALDAVLDSKDRRTLVVRALLGAWRLSLADQKRLISASMNKNVTIYLLQDGSIAPQIKAKLSSSPAFKKVKLLASYGISDYYLDAPSSPRHPAQNYNYATDTIAMLIGATPTRLATRTVNESLEFLAGASATYALATLDESSPQILAALKDASTLNSLRAWELFMHFAETANTGTLKDLLDVSVRLSRPRLIPPALQRSGPTR